jgi:hypothetical protein
VKFRLEADESGLIFGTDRGVYAASMTSSQITSKQAKPTASIVATLQIKPLEASEIFSAH